MEQSLFKVAEVEVSYKPHYKASERPKIKSSKETYDLLLNHWNRETINLFEEFKLLLLNRANHVLGIVDISVGGMTGTVVDPKIIFAVTLKSGACNIILAHNYPSGGLIPGYENIQMTKKVDQGAELLDIKVLDHIILIDEHDFFSFSDNRM